MNLLNGSISNDNSKITLFNKDKNLVLVLHEDANDHLHKCHSNDISKMVKKLYKQELLKVYREGSVYKQHGAILHCGAASKSSRGY